MSKYVIGNTYFKISYFDESDQYPNIISMVFIGKNLDKLDHSNEDVWFFQDTSSYLDQGPYPYTGEEPKFKEMPENIESSSDIYSSKEDCLELFLTVKELIDNLSSW